MAPCVVRVEVRWKHGALVVQPVHGWPMCPCVTGELGMIYAYVLAGVGKC